MSDQTIDAKKINDWVNESIGISKKINAAPSYEVQLFDSAVVAFIAAYFSQGVSVSNSDIIKEAQNVAYLMMQARSHND